MLEISFCRINNKGLRLIAACCPSLRAVSGCVSGDSVEAIKAICRACPNLLKLCLYSNYAAHGNEIIETVVQCCPFIEVLPTGGWYFSNTALDALAYTRHLKSLKFRSLDNTMSSLAIQHVLQANSNLINISLLGNCIDSALVRCIGRSCRNLKVLKFDKRYCSGVSELAFQGLFRGCSLLEVFRLSQAYQLSNDTMSTLFASCRGLSTLELFVWPLRDEDTTVTEPILNSSYPCLTKLNISGGGVTDAQLRSILTHCTNLYEVRLDSCRQVTDETIITLGLCGCLESLSIASRGLLTVACILEISLHCTNLKRLRLEGPPINDTVLIQLSVNCPNITELFLRDRDGEITEARIVALVQGCTRLRVLKLGDVALTPTIKLLKKGQAYPHIRFIVV